jgi:hypothetical protein
VLSTGARPIVELDRHRAIEGAIVSAEPGDVVLLAGKGHEPYQILGPRTIAFDDREEARSALARRRAARSSSGAGSSGAGSSGGAGAGGSDAGAGGGGAGGAAREVG